MSQSDFTLRYRRLILGGALVVLSTMSVGYDAMSNQALAQSESEQNEVTNSTRTAESGEKLSINNGTLIGATQARQEARTTAANPTTTATVTTSEQGDSSVYTNSQEVVTDSMINPSKPNGLLYGLSSERTNINEQDEGSSTVTTTSLVASNNSLVESAGQEGTESTIKEIVIYFSAPEQARANDVDSLTGASVIDKDGKLSGITEHVAQYIGQKQDIPVYKISVEQAYPSEHRALIERSYADLEQIKEAKSNLSTKLEPEVDLAQVERIYIGFPLWWNDLPLPVYTFLKQADLSGKTILPFCTYGHNAPYQLFKRLNELEPNAKIVRGLDINKHRLVKGNLHKSLERWLEENARKASDGNSSTRSITDTGARDNVGTDASTVTGTVKDATRETRASASNKLESPSSDVATNVTTKVAVN